MFQKGNQLGKSNKGKVRSDEMKLKVSKANKGRLVGEKNPLYGVRRFGKDNPAWKGGKERYENGYIFIYKPEHPHHDKDNCVLKSRLIMEEFLGRYLDPKETVHHINGIKDDDRVENLELFSSRNEHCRYHSNLRWGNIYV